MNRILSLEEREREYSPSSMTGGDYSPFVRRYIDLSEAARAAHPARVELPYGDLPTQTLDLFMPPPRADGRAPPVLAYIHGGYWQELSKNESAFAAPDCLAAGFAYCAIDYTLAPGATVAQIACECRTALRFLQRRAATLGIDGERIVVAGSSAGAHLAAMCGLRAWPGDLPLPRGLPAAAVLVSGVYELAPLVGTSIDRMLSLDAEGAAEVSPLRQMLAGFPRAVVAWGERETGAFKQQSRDFAVALTRAGSAPAEVFEVPARNHFDVVLELARAHTPLGDATLRRLAATLEGSSA